MKSLLQYITESNKKNNGFCILKPGFLNYRDEWEQDLIDNGWEIIDKKDIHMTHDLASDLYSCHKDKDFYNDLVKYMSSDKCVCCSCYKDCKDPVKEMKKLKNKCRDKWGKDEMRNAMHSSDSLEHVNRETKLIFK